MNDCDSQKRKDRNASIKNAGIAGANAETVQRFGAAVKEHIVSYSGVDNESGQRLSKGLKDISNSKVNPNYRDTNIKQQSGFSAEVKTTARESAEKIIDGKKARTVRTDDMMKQPDGRGRTVGGKNEQLYDIAEVDSSGTYIEGSARQLKYVGGNPKACADKLLSRSYDKYRNADVPIEVPSDFYDDVKRELSSKCDKLNEQIGKAEKTGNTELANKYREQLNNAEKTQKSLVKGKLTNEEAIEARLHPKLSTAKDIAKLSHKAGMEGAKIGAAIGGGISAIQNTVAVIKGDKTPQEALANVTVDTAKATATSYATNFVGSAVKGAMQNASSPYVNALSKTNLPATIVVSVLEVGKTLSKFGSGQIDGVQCLTELGEKGVGMIASSAGAAVGQVLIPIPVIGGLVGGMVGYAMSTAYYNSLVTALSEAKLAHEERLRIEAECAESIAAMKEYRLQIELAVNNYLQEHTAVFSMAFSEMEIAYNTGDLDRFISGTNSITRQLGGKPLFETKEQCDTLMKRDAIIEL